MSRDDAYLLDILESSRAALGYMHGKSWDEFSKDPLLQDAVVRRLEIIGEAAANVTLNHDLYNSISTAWIFAAASPPSPRNRMQ